MFSTAQGCALKQCCNALQMYAPGRSRGRLRRSWRSSRLSMGQSRGVAMHPDVLQGTAQSASLGALYRGLVLSGRLQEDPHQLQALKALNAVIEDIRMQQEPMNAEAPGHSSPLQPLRKFMGSVAGAAAPVMESSGARHLWESMKAQGYALCGQEMPNAEAQEHARGNSLQVYGSAAPAAVSYEAKCNGIYIWGEVGCGKTMLMDMFYHAVPVARKRRMHLAMFMSETYRRLHEYSTDKSHNQSAMEQLADAIAAESLVLCFDEFQVTDIADAAILTTLFTLLFERRIVVVATSNKTPDMLYHMNTGFGKFVELLKKHCVIHELVRTQDYRLTGTATSKTFLYPHNLDTESKLFAMFSQLTPAPVLKATKLHHFGRHIVIPYTKGPCALFSFEYLCGNDTALGPNDYKCIAEAYHTVCITGIPLLGLHNRNQSRRFISLIDELYRYKVKLVCTAAHSPDSLFAYEALSKAAQQETYDDYYVDSTTEREQGRFYIDFDHDFGDEYACDDKAYLKPEADKRFTGEDEIFAFRRVESRLKEMMTEEYLRLQHLCFTTQEVNVKMLLGTARELTSA